MRNLEKLTLSMCCLNVVTECAFTMSTGSEFQTGTTRLAKKNFLVFNLAMGIVSFSGWPRVSLNVVKLKKSVCSMQLSPFIILKHMIKSAIIRRCSNVCNLRCVRRWWYDKWAHPGMRRVKLRWTVSIRLIWWMYVGDHVVETYSRIGRM